MNMKVIDWLMTLVSVIFIMVVVLLQMKSVGAIMATVLAVGWLFRFAWGKDHV